jgi:hypothetical protein
MVPANGDRVTAGLRDEGAGAARPAAGRAGVRLDGGGAAAAARSRFMTIETVRAGSFSLNLTSSGALV